MWSFTSHSLADMDEDLHQGCHFEQGDPPLLINNLVTGPWVRGTLWREDGFCWLEAVVLIGNGGTAGVRLLGFGDREEDSGGEPISRPERPVLEGVANIAETSRHERFLMGMNADNVLVEMLVTHVCLDFLYNFVFQLLPKAFLDPAVLDDVLLLRFPVLCLEHPPIWWIGTDVVEQHRSLILHPFNCETKVKIELADPLNFRVKPEVCLGRGSEDDEKFYERVGVLEMVTSAEDQGRKPY